MAELVVKENRQIDTSQLLKTNQEKKRFRTPFVQHAMHLRVALWSGVVGVASVALSIISGGELIPVMLSLSAVSTSMVALATTPTDSKKPESISNSCWYAHDLEKIAKAGNDILMPAQDLISPRHEPEKMIIFSPNYGKSFSLLGIFKSSILAKHVLYYDSADAYVISTIRGSWWRLTSEKEVFIGKRAVFNRAVAKLRGISE